MTSNILFLYINIMVTSYIERDRCLMKDTKRKTVIIGGVAGGASCAARLR